MSESLLDSAIMVSRNALLDMPDTSVRHELSVAAQSDALGLPHFSLTREPRRRFLAG